MNTSKLAMRLEQEQQYAGRPCGIDLEAETRWAQGSDNRRATRWVFCKYHSTQVCQPSSSPMLLQGKKRAMYHPGVFIALVQLLARSRSKHPCMEFSQIRHHDIVQTKTQNIWLYAPFWTVWHMWQTSMHSITSPKGIQAFSGVVPFHVCHSEIRVCDMFCLNWACSKYFQSHCAVVTGVRSFVKALHHLFSWTHPSVQVAELCSPLSSHPSYTVSFWHLHTLTYHWFMPQLILKLVLSLPCKSLAVILSALCDDPEMPQTPIYLRSRMLHWFRGFKCKTTNSLLSCSRMTMWRFFI